MNLTNRQQGILYMILHCLALSIVNALSRLLSPGISRYQFIFLTCFVGFLIILPFALRRQYLLTFDKRQIISAIRALIRTVSLMLIYYAILNMPLAQVIAITLCHPLFTTFLSFFALKEGGTILTKSMLFVGACGALIVINPAYLADNFRDVSILPIIAAVSAVFIWSILDVIARFVSRKESVINQLTSILLFSSIMMVGVLFVLDEYKIEFRGISDMSLMFLAIVSDVISMITLFYSFKKSSLSVLAPLYFFTLIFSAICAYFIFDEVIKVNTIIGSIIIVISSSVVALKEKENDMH